MRVPPVHLLCLALATLVSTEPSVSSLRLVVVVFRHGERTPASTYAKDIYKNEDFFPYGWGQLTNKGKMEQYDQGRWLGRRYREFLGETLTPTLIQAFSTSPTRAQMSMSLMLAGLMPPAGSQIWNKNLSWQPFPWVSTGDNVDKILLSTNCPRIQEAIEEVEKTPEFVEYNRQHKDLYSYLSEHTGEKVRGPADVFDIYGTLNAEKDYGLELPEWTKKVFPEPMGEVTAKHFILNTRTTELKRLTGGRLLKKILESAKSKVETKKDNPKLIAYSGHDSTVVNLLRAIGAWEERVPQYNLMTIFELHAPTSNSSTWTIKVILRNSVKEEPILLRAPGCEEICPFEDFVKATSDVIPQDLENECKTQDQDYKPERPLPGP